MSAVQLTKADKMLIERCHTGPVSFTYEPCPAGRKHAKLVRSTISVTQQKKLHALAVQGLVAERITGCTDGGPPTTTIEYTVTAAGREALGIACPVKPPVHWHALPTEEQMAKEGLE